MGKYIIKRLLLSIPVIFLVATLVFFLIRLIPGDPVDYILGENALASDRNTLIQAQHFDEPIYKQYQIYLSNLLQFDLGTSYFSQKKVSTLIGQRFLATLELALAAVLWALLISIPLGIWSAINRGNLIDKGSLFFSLLGISIPTFYLGPILVLIFSIQFDIFPVSGRELNGSIILPSFTLGAALAAILMRMTRTSLVEVLDLDYIRTAKAKGLSSFKVVVKHALRSALIPVIAILGLQFGTLLAGAIVTEKIFSWPGLGSLMLESISKRDYIVVQGCILLIGISYVFVNLLTDLIYVKVDPRIKLK